MPGKEVELKGRCLSPIFLFSFSLCDPGHASRKHCAEVLDLSFRVEREPGLKKLPPADEVARALEELADEALTLGEAEQVRQCACPSEKQLDMIRAAR